MNALSSGVSTVCFLTWRGGESTPCFSESVTSRSVFLPPVSWKSRGPPGRALLRAGANRLPKITSFRNRGILRASCSQLCHIRRTRDIWMFGHIHLKPCHLVRLASFPFVCAEWLGGWTRQLDLLGYVIEGTQILVIRFG